MLEFPSLKQIRQDKYSGSTLCHVSSYGGGFKHVKLRATQTSFVGSSHVSYVFVDWGCCRGNCREPSPKPLPSLIFFADSSLTGLLYKLYNNVTMLRSLAPKGRKEPAISRITQCVLHFAFWCGSPVTSPYLLQESQEDDFPCEDDTVAAPAIQSSTQETVGCHISRAFYLNML